MSYEKRGKRYRVTYRYNGVLYHEHYDTEKQAKARDAMIKVEKEAGTFAPPHAVLKPELNPLIYGKGITVRELMQRFVEEYGPTEWKPNVLAQNRSRIEHYINPYLGDERILDLSVQQIEQYYRDLLKTPSVDDPNKTVGRSVIEKIHTMLCTAFTQAQRWGYLPREAKSVVSLARRPKYRSDECTIWTPDQFRTALECCDHNYDRMAKRQKAFRRAATRLCKPALPVCPIFVVRIIGLIMAIIAPMIAIMSGQA